jgi:hypothetical protein
MHQIVSNFIGNCARNQPGVDREDEGPPLKELIDPGLRDSENAPTRPTRPETR